MKCRDCNKWAIILSQGSERGDKSMELMGWKNCKANKSHIAFGMFYHAEHECTNGKQKLS